MKLQKLRIAIIAAALLAVPLAIAQALTYNPTYVPQAREPVTQQVVYYRFTVNYNDPNIGTGVAFGKLRQNAFITGVACHVTAAFNAATTNKFTLGFSTSPSSQLIRTTDVILASPQYQSVSSPGLGLMATSAGDQTLYAAYGQTGTAATAGSVTCVLTYILNNDQ